MKRVIVFLSILVFSVEFLNSQDAKKILEKYGDLYFWFELNDKNDLDKIPEYISIDAVRGNRVYAYVHKNDYDKLLNSYIDFHPIDKAGENKSILMAYNVSEMSGWDRYPTYDVYLQMMQNFASSYPNIARLDTIGISQQGRLILVLKITDNPETDEYEPEFFYTSTMHGDETAGFIFMLRLIDTLLTSYGANPEITDLVNNMEIWINPLANPDGTYAGGDDDISGASRYLADGTDQNRDFPPPANYQTPSSLETFQMMAFAEEHNFVMSANFHGGAEVANYPWDQWTSNENLHADDNWWQYVATIYAQSAQNNSPSGYFEGVTSSGIIEGGDWYVVTGSRQDYMNYYQHCREITIELSNTKLLDVELLNAYWNYNAEALFLYMEQVLYGFRGIVTDGCSGEPIKAKIEVLNHDYDGSEVYSSENVGDWYRPIFPGTYDLQITAEGYDTMVFSGVTINYNESVELNSVLYPLPPSISIEIDSSGICNGEVVFLNHSVGGTEFFWDFGDGNFSTEENPIHVYEDGGVYNVKLVVTNSCEQSDSLEFSLNVTRPQIHYYDVYFCGVSDVQFNIGGDGITYWYSDSVSTVPIYVGNQFSINGLEQDTIFYIENVVGGQIYTGGEDRINSGGSFYNGYSVHGLYFDVYKPSTLISVDMNAGSDGDREIKITDKLGNVIFDTTIFLPAGESTVQLNASLPIGDSLLFRCVDQFPDLFRNNTGTSYPYDIEDILTITTSTAGDNYYYYFYNWQIKSNDCKSSRKQVGAYYTDELPVASFTYTQNNGVYQFINNSNFASTYFWDFGDGYTSYEYEPQHQYAQEGNYTVVLVAENDCGSDTASQDILFVSESKVSNVEEQVEVYPTITKGKIYIKSSQKISRILCYDITGRIVKKINNLNTGFYELDLSDLKSGIYFLKVLDFRKKVVVKKIEKK